MSDQIPEEILKRGRPEAVFGPYPSSKYQLKQRAWRSVAVFTFAMAALLLIGAAQATPSGGQSSATLTAAAFFLVGGIRLRQKAARLPDASDQAFYYLHRDWVANRAAGICTAVSFADAKSLTYDPERSGGYVLQGADGSTIVLSDSAPDELVQEVTARVVSSQLPLALASYRRGEELRYGPIALSRSGLKLGNVSAEWKQLDHCVSHTRRGQPMFKFKLTAPARSVSFPTSEIPNCPVMVAVLEKVLPR